MYLAKGEKSLSQNTQDDNDHAIRKINNKYVRWRMSQDVGAFSFWIIITVRCHIEVGITPAVHTS